MSEISEVNKQKWEELLLKSKFSTYFYTWKFREIVEIAWPWAKPCYFEYTNRDNHAIAGFFRYKDMMISLPFCEYGAVIPLSKTFDLSLFLNDVSIYFKSRFNCSKIRIKLHPYAARSMKTDTNPTFIHKNSLSTFLLEDLQSKSEIDLLKSFRKTTRHSIRYAKEEGLSIKEVETEEELRSFYQVYLLTMRKNMAPAAPYLSFNLIKSIPDAEMLIAKKGGIVIAGVIFLKKGNIINYSTSANHPAYKSNANYLLLWQGILKAKAEGVNYFDFGATRQGSPLEIFKKGWGTVQRHINIYERGFKGNSAEKSFIRKIWAKMPIFIIERLSDQVFRRTFG